jgi:integrase
MAPRLSSSTLATPTARLRLKVRRLPYYIPLGRGLSLGYRRNLGDGTWLVRQADGAGGEWTKRFASADDFASDDGQIDFSTAVDRAKQLVRGQDASKPVTFEQALADHARDLKLRGAATADKVRRLLKILPASLRQRPVGLLTMRELRRWRDELRASGLAAATVGRLSRTLAAALNHAAAGDDAITNQKAWKVGLQALPDSYRARTNAVLDDDQVRAVVRACRNYSVQLGLFAEVLAATGARPVQAARLLVGDLTRDGVMMPRSLKGRGEKKVTRRPLPLSPALLTKLRLAAAGRPATAPLLVRDDSGNGWTGARTTYSRPFGLALKAAGLPKVVPYALRHSHITRSLQNGVPAALVADSCDTSTAMLQRNYARFISDHSGELLLRAQIDLDPPAAENIVSLAERW